MYIYVLNGLHINKNAFRTCAVMWQSAPANIRLKAQWTGTASSQKMFTDAPLPRFPFVLFSNIEKHVNITRQTKVRFSHLKSVMLEVMKYYLNHLYLTCLQHSLVSTLVVLVTTPPEMIKVSRVPKIYWFLIKCLLGVHLFYFIWSALAGDLGCFFSLKNTCICCLC